jgi:para-nitrobenzyl esterase
MDRRQVIGSAAAAAGLATAGGAWAASGPTAVTLQGKVRGQTAENGVRVFAGIPYGAPTDGANRWRAPRPPAAWSGVRDCVSFGDQSPQAPSPVTPMFTSWDRKVGESEDCLRLNVWTPGTDARKRPVMVWLHGGGFAQYNGSSPAYDGDRLCRRGDVVLVTVNHRLNIFGYLYLEEIGGEAWAGAANAGQLDLIAALQWVKDNIAAFGGDPNNVTIFGESGGGAKVCTLMAMPGARGLFHKAIVQSGPLIRAVPKASATAAARAVLARLKIGESQLDQLASVPAAQLIDAYKAVAGPWDRVFAPVVDGASLPRDPFEPDAPDMSATVPLLIGTNKDEMNLLLGSSQTFGLSWDTLPVALTPLLPHADVDQIVEDYRKIRPQATAPDVFFGITTQLFMTMDTVKIAERKAAQGAAPAFVYEVEWETPVMGGRFKSPHAVEIAFVFDTVAKSESMVGSGKEPQAMADQMCPAWIAFARTGAPQIKTLPAWPAYDATRRATMLFNLQSQVADDPRGDERALLKDVPAIGMAG